jgi:hypothetical protein
MIVLALMLIMLSIAVNAIFIAQSNRNLDALLAGQANSHDSWRDREPGRSRS